MFIILIITLGYQTVNWIVSTNKRLKIKATELDLFRKTIDETGKFLKENYRKIQPLNGRKLFNSNTYTL